MNTGVLYLFFHLFASSNSDPDPDTHFHLHLEQEKGAFGLMLVQCSPCVSLKERLPIPEEDL